MLLEEFDVGRIAVTGTQLVLSRGALAVASLEFNLVHWPLSQLKMNSGRLRTG